jgi:two-component system cell cycle response regulator DivK
LSLTRQLKADAQTRAVAVVAFTAYAMKSAGARTHPASCDGYLAKPIDVATFVQLIRCYLSAGARA